MEIIQNRVRSHEKYYYFSIIVLWVIYAVLIFQAPDPVQTSGRYGLSTGEINILRITVLLPYLIIWGVGLFAILRFSRYLKYLNDNSKEDKGFRRIIYGLWLLLIILIIPNFIGLLVTYNPESADIQKWVIILRNYINIVLYFLAFWFIYKASKDLATLVQPVKKMKISRIIFVFIGLIAIVYLYLLFHNEFRGFSNDVLIKPTYYLSDPAIIITIFLPYLIIWTVGLFAIGGIYNFARNVHGIVYRKSFSWISYGLSSILGLSIALQFLSQSSAYFGRAGLSIVLSIIYLLLFAIAIGYLLIAKGAKELTSIEEV